jgi:hypothetical protein
MRTAQQRPLLLEALAWTGRILSLPLALFLLVDGGIRLLRPADALGSILQLNKLEQVIVPLVTVPQSSTGVNVPQAAILDALRFTANLSNSLGPHLHVPRTGDAASSVLLGTVVFGTLLVGMIESYEL